ncbi:uncharacterized protein EAF01_003610 [Botrytis porri]|uniref:Uncharacterized protein n=1 Tax=Botrytis porri TaxID=87229 RepID=A0A4Z1K857_9HELO|nr:uncharacterized protein EAF01_003610 [Botrytis porri]KAF7909892.1 hypothetical protein EAF01_003610 [Botrytis porri]TGO81636.1 hypothetical protein BPOR_1074g00010 [Botrytis porri]
MLKGYIPPLMFVDSEMLRAIHLISELPKHQNTNPPNRVSSAICQLELNHLHEDQDIVPPSPADAFTRAHRSISPKNAQLHPYYSSLLPASVPVTSSSSPDMQSGLRPTLWGSAIESLDVYIYNHSKLMHHSQGCPLYLKAFQ